MLTPVLVPINQVSCLFSVKDLFLKEACTEDSLLTRSGQGVSVQAKPPNEML